MSIINSGLISSDFASVIHIGDEDQSIENTGEMIGFISLRGGAVTIDMRGATIVGTVRGNDGDDVLIGGRGADVM